MDAPSFWLNSMSLHTTVSQFYIYTSHCQMVQLLLVCVQYINTIQISCCEQFWKIDLVTLCLLFCKLFLAGKGSLPPIGMLILGGILLAALVIMAVLGKLLFQSRRTLPAMQAQLTLSHFHHSEIPWQLFKIIMKCLTAWQQLVYCISIYCYVAYIIFLFKHLTSS